MSTKDDGGPAFPVTVTDRSFSAGMTLRDWFAGQVIGQLLAAPSGLSLHDRVEVAFGIAELMVAESKK